MRLDPGAFDALYARYSDRLYSVSVRITGDRGLAEDVVQETFVKAYTAPNDVVFDDVGAWLTTVARNGSLNAIRKRSRTVTLAEEADEDKAAAPLLAADAASSDPLRAIASADAVRTVWSLVESLRPEARAALVARYAEEEPIEAIASALGKTVNATTVLLHRARASLRAAYAERVFARAGLPAACRARKVAILAHLEAPAQADPELLEHIAVDPWCQETIAELRSMSRVLAVAPVFVAPAGLKATVVTALGAQGVAVAAGAGAGSASTMAPGGTVTTGTTSTTGGGVLAGTTGKVLLVSALLAVVGGGAILAIRSTGTAIYAAAELGHWANGVGSLQLATTEQRQLFALWSAPTGQSIFDVLVASREANGRWGSPSVIGQGGTQVPRLALAPSGEPCAFFSVWDNTKLTTVVMNRCWDSSKWVEGAPEQVGGIPEVGAWAAGFTSDGEIRVAPQQNSAADIEIVRDGDGRLHKAWIKLWTTSTVLHSYSEDGGRTWTDQEVLGEIDPWKPMFLLPAPQGGVELFWKDGAHLTRRSWHATSGWAAQTVVSDVPDGLPFSGAYFAAALLPDGRACLAIAHEDGIYFSTETAQGTWSNAIRVVSLSTWAGVALGAAPDGTTVLGWETDGTVFAGQTVVPGT